MNRRDLIKCLAAGGTVVAGELWVPKLISIPSGKVFGQSVVEIVSDYEFTINYVRKLALDQMMIDSLADEILMTPKYTNRYTIPRES